MIFTFKPKKGIFMTEISKVEMPRDALALKNESESTK